MKKALLLSAAAVAAMSTMAQTTKTFNCVADTWIRENNLTYSGSSAATLETNQAKDDEGNTYSFAALYGFSYNVPAGMKVQKATLTLITARYKGGTVDLYGYPNNFSENATWESEASYIAQVEAGNYLYQFNPAGQWNKDMGLDVCDENKQSLSEWTNNFDVTDYVKSLPTTASRVNFFLTHATSQNCFYSKDNQGTDAFKQEDGTFLTHFEASELMPYLEVTFVEDSDTSLDTILPAADTQIRWNNTTNYGGNPAMEIYTRLAEGYEPGDANPEYQQEFYGLLRFNIPSELLDTDKYELNGAQLRLVCVQWKNDRNMQLFDYANSFAENTTFANEESYVRSALSSTPVAEFEANGASNWAMGDKERFGEEYATAEAWTSYIDLTDYVAGKAADGVNTINLLLKRRDDNASGSGNAMKFATKEAADIVGTLTDGTEVTFKAADLVPELTLSYSKKAGSDDPEIEVPGENEGDNTGVANIEDTNAPALYYNLQGVQVANPDKGIYIVRQGNSVKKVVVK